MSHSKKSILSVKFFIQDPLNHDHIVYRWMTPITIRHLDWDKIIEKLHYVTSKKYSGFEMTWYDGFHHCVLTNTKDLRKAVELMQNRRTEDNCVRLHVRAIPKLLRPECRSQINDDTQFSGQYLPSYLEAIGLQPSIQNDSIDNEKQFFNQDLFPKHEYRW
uniref:PB1 domain-containing protein n=1 Tax=Schistosoma mansoni TaxID=6183 RepID=A0A3Q0KEJ2_SCHMA